MYFIGAQELNAVKGDHRLIASMFDRLPKEAKCTGATTRFIGYESPGDETAAGVRFFGIEADAIESIPDGLVAWDLNDPSFTISEPKEGRNTIIWQENITWLWLGKSTSLKRWTTGEFRARGPAEWRSGRTSEHRAFSLFANVPFDCGKRGFSDDVFLVDYDPKWPKEFERMARWLRSALGPDVARHVEHYGSTAIPAMPAKPVIDILVEVPSFEKAKRRALPILNGETWEYWWYADHIVFFKRKEMMGERRFHIHMAPAGHEIWKGIAFRDYLRSHPEDATRYASLKRRLAAAHRSDRERYTQMKTSFIEEVIQAC
jgi:GrpB-like predicted nucleotidyltransferase (UPF0157 family)